MFLWNDPQARRRVKMGPSGAEYQDRGRSGIFTITDKHCRLSTAVFVNL
jgi:hypothetical protein